MVDVDVGIVPAPGRVQQAEIEQQEANGRGHRRPASESKPLITYSHGDLRLAEALQTGNVRARLSESSTDFYDSITQGSLGDPHKSGEGAIQLQNQVDRSRNRQGAHDQGSDHSWVPGCEETEARKDDR